MANVLTLIFNLLKSSTPGLNVFLGLMTLAVPIITYIADLWGGLFAKLDAMIIPALPSSLDFSPLGYVNYIFPMDTCLTFTAAYLVLYALSASIRIIKSFIPTIS